MNSSSKLLLIAGTLALALPAQGQRQLPSPPEEPEVPKAIPIPEAMISSKPAEKPKKKMSWRDLYLLGPGDVITIRFFGRNGLNRGGIRVAPDGTITYLTARSVYVTGFSIDQARKKLEKALTEQYRNPRLIITPVEVASKRFSILGKVVKKGVYTLDRPMNLVEAIANAGGLETGLFERNTIELADFDRSFLLRDGERLKIDFRSVFLEANLDPKQNVDIEPGDFIYVASNISNDYYVFGEVKNPGVQGLTPGATVTEAITRRGGFAPTAWETRVLVVRGSISNPKVFPVDVTDILAGKKPDFKLQPKDILYVADRPWKKAETLTQLAVRGFISAAASSWVSQNVPPLLNPDASNGSE